MVKRLFLAAAADKSSLSAAKTATPAILKRVCCILFCTAVLAGNSALGGAETLFKGETVIFPAPATTSQMASVIIVTCHGKVIVVDGGTAGDLDSLKKTLAPYGSVVHYWFLSHAHHDHFGAFAELDRRNFDGLRVEHLCYHFPSIQWLREVGKCAAADLEKVRTRILGSKVPAVILRKEMRFSVDGVEIEVLNDPDTVYIGNAVNNSSVVLMVTISGKRLLLPGDISAPKSLQMVKELGTKLKADIVLMSHHGQHGAAKEFYAAAAPTIAVWTTPRWLWDNTKRPGGPGSGPWKTNYTKCWLQELNVRQQYVTGFGTVTLR